MSNFHVGQRVICIDPVDDLRRSALYIVTLVGGGEYSEFIGVDGSCFKGADFYAWRFRPIVERKTDISGFKAMLNPSNQKVTA